MHPYAANLPYIETQSSTEQKMLKKHHPYYAQVHGQMAMTGALWCDFFVYSSHGHHMERIAFDEEYWKNILDSLIYFFNSVLGHELISRDIMAGKGKTTEMPSQISSSGAELGDSDTATGPSTSTGHVANTPKSAMSSTRRLQKKKKAQNRGRRAAKKPKLEKMYLCPKCKVQVENPDESTDPTMFGIMCEQCEKWFHWGCVGIDVVSPDLDNDYCCESCNNDTDN